MTTRRGRSIAHSTVSLAHKPASDRLVALVKHGDELELFELKAKTIVGRDRSCDIVIDDEAMSRKHLRIERGRPVTVEDLGSRNGTTVRGERIAPHEPIEVQLGEPIAIGGVQVFVESARSRPISPPEGIVIADPRMQQLYKVLEVVAASPLRVLITGETGSGKEVIARAVHARSQRATRTFLAINCAALAEGLLESELFGHDKGAFTGAVSAKAGLFEASDGGTLFLDEIGELSAATQAKLLRVLESGEVLRIGSVKPSIVDVRVIAATHRDLRARVTEGAFRQDLYYRLDGATLVLPPLRERLGELEPLARRFATEMAGKLGVAPPTIRADAIAALARHAWPGNVRELRNVIERAVVMRAGAALRASDLELAKPTARPPAGDDLWSDIEHLERQRIVDALAATAGNQSAAARRLGIARATLIKRIEQFGLARPKKT